MHFVKCLWYIWVVLYFEVVVQWNWRWEKEFLCSYHLGIAWPDPITGCGFIVAYWGLHTHFTWVTEVTVLWHFKFAAMLKVCACTYGSVVDSLGLFNWRTVSDTCQWWLGWEGSPPTKIKVITPLFPQWCFMLFPGHNCPTLRELRFYEVRMLFPCLTPPHYGGPGCLFGWRHLVQNQSGMGDLTHLLGCHWHMFQVHWCA